MKSASQPKKSKFKKPFILILLIIGVISVINYFIKTKSGPYNKYNNLQSRFHQEYKTLQEERVRVAALAQAGEDEKTIIKQIDTMHTQAQKTYDTLVEMYETAQEIEITKDDRVTFLVRPVYAKSLTDFGKDVIWNLPLVGRLANGFDATTDSLRLGLYKAYHNGIEGDQEVIEELMRERGIDSPEKLLTAPAKDITWVFSNVRSSEAADTIANEVDLAEVAVKGGISAVKAYFDGVLLVTGVKTIDIQGEILNQLGVSPDLQSFIKMGLGDTTAEEYVEGKLKDQFLELYEYTLTPEEINSIMNEDSEEIKAILARAKEDASEGQNESIKSILALSETALNLAKEVAEKDDIDTVTPYHEWPLETQRELAQVLNSEEEKGPLLVSGETKSGSLTNYLVPSGAWNILTSSKGNIPGYIYNFEKDNGKTGSLISLTTRLANAKAAEEMFELEATTYEQLEEEGLLTAEDITRYTNQTRAREENTGISKLLQPLRNLIQNPPWEKKNTQDTHIPLENQDPGIDNDGIGNQPLDAGNSILPGGHWMCEDWDPCNDGVQNRKCWDGDLDENKKVIYNIETRECENQNNTTDVQDNSNNQSDDQTVKNCTSSNPVLNAVCSGQRPPSSGTIPNADGY